MNSMILLYSRNSLGIVQERYVICDYCPIDYVDGDSVIHESVPIYTEQEAIDSGWVKVMSKESYINDFWKCPTCAEEPNNES